MNDAPVKLITISGIFNAPDNRPLPGITLKLRTRKYTNRLFQNEEISCVTGRGGEYSLSVLPGDYEASCTFIPDKRGEVLGVVHIEPDSIDGTLNDFLGLTAGMSYPPSIMVKIIEWVDLAEYYAEQAAQAAKEAGVTPCGEYDPAAAYVINDLVQFAGSEYRATSPTAGIEPPAAPWDLFVSIGSTGPANKLEIGTVETLPAGSAATVTIEGEPGDQTINFGIPKGDLTSVDGIEPDETGDIKLGAYSAENPPPIYIPGKGEPGFVGLFTYGSATTKLYPGNNVSGSSIMYAGVNDGPSAILHNNPAGAGSWCCCGYIAVSDGGTVAATVFQRRDIPATFQTKLLRAGRITVSNCRYASADGSLIDCDVTINGAVYPFTVTANDCTEHVPYIYANAKAGKYGNVEPFKP